MKGVLKCCATKLRKCAAGENKERQDSCLIADVWLHTHTHTVIVMRAREDTLIFMTATRAKSNTNGHRHQSSFSSCRSCVINKRCGLGNEYLFMLITLSIYDVHHQMPSTLSICLSLRSSDSHFYVCAHIIFRTLV
jgi:hypothetical protein